MEIRATVALDGDTRRACNNESCANDYPCRIHRETIRCSHCKLMQFKTQNGNCRKCRKAYVEEKKAPAAVAVPEVVLVSAERLDLAFAIRVVRQASSISQRQLALRTGLQRTYVSKLECEAAVPTIKSLLTIAKGLDVEPWVLIYFAELPTLGTVQRAA